MKNPHAMASAVSACSAAVKTELEAVNLDGVPHAHSRYKIAVTATYPRAERYGPLISPISFARGRAHGADA